MIDTNMDEGIFENIFEEISPEKIFKYFDLFAMVGKEYFAITAGDYNQYNSMVGSGGGFGLFFKKPSTWCLIKTDRYTLELIIKKQKYTLSYFPNENKEKMLFLGSKSGRDTQKMKEVELSIIQTPSGQISFREAVLIIECSLTSIITPSPNDFYSKESKEYIDEAYKDPSDYRKLVFGEINNVWLKK
jgi:hypothetical protein